MSAPWFSSPFAKQCFAATGTWINIVGQGFIMGYPAALLSQLRDTNEILLDKYMESNIASIFSVSCVLGIVLVPSIMNRFGRKFLTLISSALMIIGWILIMLSNSFHVLLIGRFIHGFSIGCNSFGGLILLGEYSSPKYRDVIITGTALFLFSGISASGIIYKYMSWQKLALTYGIVNVLGIFSVFYSPESPSYLALRGRYEECRKVFLMLRGDEEICELEILINNAKMIRKHSKKETNILLNFKKSFTYFIATVYKKEFYKSIIIMCHLYSMMIFTGGLSFFCYTADIVHFFCGEKYILFTTSVLAISGIVGIILSTFIIRKVRRRRLLLIGAILLLFCYVCMFVYGYLKIKLVVSYSMLGLLLLVFKWQCMIIVIYPVTNVLAGEIYPLAHRGMCGMCAMIIFSLDEFVDVKVTPYLFTSVGVHGSYLVRALMLVYCLVIVMIMLPETKDRQMLDIEAELRDAPSVNTLPETETKLLDQ